MKNNLPISTIVAAIILTLGCNQSSQADDNMPPGDTNSSLSATQHWQNVRDIATNDWQKVKNTSTNAWAKIKEGTTNAWAETKDSFHSAMNYSYDKKDDFVATAKTDLNALDQKIQELSDKAATASGSVKSEAELKLQNLRAKRAELDVKLDAVKNSSKADWNKVKTGFQTGYDDVKTSLKQAWQWLTDKINS